MSFRFFFSLKPKKEKKKNIVNRIQSDSATYSIDPNRIFLDELAGVDILALKVFPHVKNKNKNDERNRATNVIVTGDCNSNSGEPGMGGR